MTRRVPVAAPVPLVVSVTALAVELGGVVVATGFTPATPAWLALAVWVLVLVAAAVCVGTLRWAVSGRPRASRHHTRPRPVAGP